MRWSAGQCSVAGFKVSADLSSNYFSWLIELFLWLLSSKLERRRWPGQAPAQHPANGSVLCSRAELQTEDQSWISVFIDCIVRYLQVAIIYFLTCIDFDFDPLL